MSLAQRTEPLSELYQSTMAMIRARKRNDGSVRYPAQIRLFSRRCASLPREPGLRPETGSTLRWRCEAELGQLDVIERAN